MEFLDRNFVFYGLLFVGFLSLLSWLLYKIVQNVEKKKVDRISALPEPILQHIISLLPFKQAVQTRLLSKTWKKAMDTSLILEVGDFYDPRNRMKMFRYLQQTMQMRRSEMLRVVKFTLKIGELSYEETASIDQCLYHAVACDVKELKVVFRYWLAERLYSLPEFVLLARSINLLKLRGCVLELGTPVSLTSLRSLCLKKVVASDHIIKNVVAGCPLIEYLRIDECEGFKNLELSDLYKLKTVYVRSYDELERIAVEPLSVHSVTIIYRFTFCRIKLAPCKNLKHLKLSRLTITDVWFCKQISKLQLLEHLDIDFCSKLKSIKILWPRLQTLFIGVCSKLESIKILSPRLQTLFITDCCSLVEANMDTPSLRVFKYRGPMISLSLNALALSEANLNFVPEEIIDFEWFRTYFEILAKFHQISEVLNLQSCSSEMIIVPTQPRQIFPPPLSGAKNLNFTHLYLDVSIPNIDLLDSLLWIAPHVETLSIEICNSKFFFQFSYKNPLIYKGETPCCCKFRPVSCWQQCIQKIEIEYTRKAKGTVVAVKRFSFKNKDFLQKIKRILYI